jgi:YfiH family protein
METIISDEESLAEAGFYWRERGGIKVLICRPLEEAGFTNGFSTRLGGVSPFPENSLNLAGFDEDTAENILENRQRFLGIFGGDYTLTSSWQVHGNDVKVVATERDAENTEEKFDALISDLPHILIGVKTADCVPILIGDPKTSSFAAVHSGWRGTAQSIVSHAVEKMQEAYGSVPADLICAIGPAALCGRYEIGQDVIDAFAASLADHEKYFSPTRDGHALVDLHLANEDLLAACGVSPASIFKAPFCTIERTDLFFSYRVEKKLYGRSGRMMSVIGLK